MSSVLRVSPEILTFRDVSVGESETASIRVLNTGKIPIKIRFILSNTSQFKLVKDGLFTVAPGLEAVEKVKFIAPDLNKYSDIIKVDSPSGSLTIPIVAFPPAPRLDVDHPHIELSSVSVNTDTKFDFTLTNVGTADAQFSISFTEPAIKLNPLEGNLPPASSITINGTFSPKTVDVFDTSINVDCIGIMEPVPPIKLTASSVNNSISFLLNNHPIQFIDFNSIFYGQKRTINTTLVNNSQQKKSFIILPPQDPTSKSVSAKSMTFIPNPSEGTINAFGSLDVAFTFQPKSELQERPPDDDFESSYTHFSAIEVVETSQRLEFQLIGKAVYHRIYTPIVDFDFGESLPSKRSTKTLTIENNSHFLPTSFEIKEAAYFHFSPNQGSIPKGKSLSVDVTFFPKAFGEYEKYPVINFNKGLEKVPLSCTGKCVPKIDAKPFVREPITARDSTARFNYNHPDPRYQYTPEQSMKLSEKRKEYNSYISDTARRKKARNDEKAYISKTRKNAETMFVGSDGQIDQEEVNNYIQTKLRERENNEDSVNLGLKTCDGLKPPDPPLRRQREDLLSTRRMKSKNGFDLTSTNNLNATQKGNFDENVLIKKKFKPKPTTPTEINDCSHPLTPAQQLNVEASHQSINFGNMSVYSTLTKSFTITNNLQQNILISMVYNADEMKESSPTSQVIPANQTAGFDIKFKALKPVNFNKPIEYTINSAHTFQVPVTAIVSPIDLQLSKSVINFKFTSGSSSPFVKEYVTIHNKSSSEAHFSWESTNPSFSLSTLSGYIEAHKTVNVEITYIPGRKNTDETTLLLKVDGGPSRSLKCIGTPGSPKCALMRKKIDFGLVPVGISKSQVLKIKNSGEDDAIFSVTNPNLSELSISPASGRIGAHDTCSFEVQFKTSQAHSFSYNVVVEIAGASALTFNVSGQSELPKVELSVGEFEYGKVFVGSTTSIEAKLTNVGSIPAILFLDLLNKPEFRIEYSSELADRSSDGQQCNSISLVSDHFFITSDMDNGLLTSEGEISPKPPASESGHFQRFKNKNAKNNKEASGLIYKIYLIENSSIDFNLVFQPTEVNEHSFELPMTLMNVATSSSYHLQPIVSAEAVQAPISLSANSLDFGITPVYNANNPHARPSVSILTINNDTKGSVTWHFDIEPDQTFNFEPKQGSLQYGESVNVHMSFTPQTAGPFNFYLPLFAKTEKEDDCLISKIKLTGVGSPLKFKMSHADIFLPIVPLNMKSEMTIYVINQAFIDGKLKAETMFDKKVCPIEVNFPEGNILSAATVQLPVSVTFQSATPSSFSTLVAIVDEKGNATSFNVSCTTDNSIFTLYPFINGLGQNKVIINSADGGKPIMLDTSLINGNLMNTNVDISQAISVSDVLELSNQNLDADYPRLMKMADFVVRFFNSKVMNTPITDFPNDFIRNDGALLQEIINNFSGGKKNGFDNFSNDRELGMNSSCDPVMKKKDSMKKIIHNLQSMGALLSSVKPEFLLSRADFISIMKTKIIKKLLGIDYFKAPEISDLDQKALSEFTSSKEYSTSLISRIKALESAYEMISFKSWLMLMMQILKIFVINKVDGEKLNSVPGVSETIKILKTFGNQNLLININRPSKNLSLSNIFSTSECGLLKWISLYMSRESDMLIAPVIDFADLNDSIGFLSVVKLHTGHSIDLEIDKENVHTEQTAIELRNIMKDLKLSFIPKAEDIFNGDRTVLAVISAYLFELMPHFIPKSTIEFNTSLHKVVTQTFSLSNPSKAEITYSATIDDTFNFSLPNDTIVVQPSETVDVPIVFYAKTIRPLAGRLELVPSRPRMVSNTNVKEGQIERSKQNDTMKSTTSIQSHTVARAPVFSAPIVLNIKTNVSFKNPDESYSLEGQIYQSTPLNLNIKNFLKASCHLTVKSHISLLIDEYGKTVQQPSLQTVVNSMISGEETVASPSEDQPLAADTAALQMLKAHKSFVVHESEVVFSSEDEESKDFEIEFIPISLGTFRLLLLFIDEDAGEFIVEVKAKANLPQAVEVAEGKLKSQCGQKSSASFQVDSASQSLSKAVAYSLERCEMFLTYRNDRKFKEQLTRRLREVESVFRQGQAPEKYKVINSSPTYFEIPNEVTLKPTKSDIQITFKPSKPGDYPCHLLFISKYDVRHFLINAVGIASTREVTVEFVAIAGRTIKQDIPIKNPSEDVWNFKVTVEGDSAFTAPSKLTAKPSEVTSLPIQFHPFKIGTYASTVTLFNINKESTVIYRLSGTADEPPAEEKLILECQARQKSVQKIDVKPVISSGVLQVTTTVPIITFNPTVTVSNDQVNNGRPFEFTIMAPRSGVSAGTITFTDPVTKSFIWYILEIHVNSPDPEETIEVKTVARKSSSVTIPITNSKPEDVHFNVTFSDDDIYGESEFTIPGNCSKDYKVVVSPLKAMKRFSSIYFYSDDDGEFWYSLKIEATDAPEATLAQLTAPIGKSASTFIILENPLTDKTINFRIENENQTSFVVVSKKSVITLAPKEKRRVEIRYIPSSVGVKESTTVAFISNDTGEFVYHLFGTGKPPQPLSPVIVSCPKNSVNSALILFNNPFPYPGRFTVSMSSENGDIFNFLVKKKVFTLNSYDEEFQIPFSFAPKEIGQYKAFIIVASLGPSKGPLPDLEFLPSVRWVYPIIGNSISEASADSTVIKCRALSTVFEEVNFTLVGENEIFKASEYSLSVVLPPGYEFLKFAIDAEAKDVQVENNELPESSSDSSSTTTTTTVNLLASIRFAPQKPLHCVAILKVRNPLSQEWSFDIELCVDKGKPISTIVIESLLNKQGTAKVSVPFAFRSPTPFVASFLPGSASELNVEPKKGTILPSFSQPTELPITILFAPKMYGKILKGVLIVDTQEAQYLFDVIGKTPEYVPPDVSNMSARINNQLPEDVQKFHEMQKKKHRNIIRDNIENVKTARRVPITTNSKVVNPL